MGRKKKTLHDYAAEFEDLGVKHVVEQQNSMEKTLLEILYCKSCEIPVRVRRDRILEHLASARHYRNRRLAKLWDQKPTNVVPETEFQPRSPEEFDSMAPLLPRSPVEFDSVAPLLPRSPVEFDSVAPLQSCSPAEFDSVAPLPLQSRLILYGNQCSPSSSSSRAFPGSKLGSSGPSCATTCTPSRKGTAPTLGNVSPSVSLSKSRTSPASEIKSQGLSRTPPASEIKSQGLSRTLPASEAPAWNPSPWPKVAEPPNSANERPVFGEMEPVGVAVGLALFGAGSACRTLCQSLVEESCCHLLYIVEDQRWEVESIFSQEHLAHTRVVRTADMDIVLSDQRVKGIMVCSPPDEASPIVLSALRAGKGVLCEKLPSFDRQVAECCFDEAERRGRPLVCGFYKRFDPALQYLHKRVHENDTLGRIQRISAVSRLYPRPTVASIRSSGGIFHSMAVHDIDVVCWMLGETAPDTVFSLGHAFCEELASMEDADSISVCMKFPSGAIALLDISQHCNMSCDQRLEVHGTEGSLQMENRNPLGVSDYSTSSGLCLQSTAERFRDAYRELLRHFLKTLRGKETPFCSREQCLWTMQVATAAEQSWRTRSSLDLRNETADTVIKTEV